MIKFESCLKYKLSAKAICMGEWRGEGRGGEGREHSK